MSKRSKTFGLFIVLIGLGWFGAANPFDFFVRRSENFSMKAFRSIRPGMQVEDAVAKLGAPIKVVSSSYDLGCPDCTAHYFQGDPPTWLLSFREAWLLVDPSGKIVSTIVNSEP